MILSKHFNTKDYLRCVLFIDKLKIRKKKIDKKYLEIEKLKN